MDSICLEYPRSRARAPVHLGFVGEEQGFFKISTQEATGSQRKDFKAWFFGPVFPLTSTFERMNICHSTDTFITDESPMF